MLDTEDRPTEKEKEGSGFVFFAVFFKGKSNKERENDTWNVESVFHVHLSRIKF